MRPLPINGKKASPSHSLLSVIISTLDLEILWIFLMKIYRVQHMFNAVIAHDNVDTVVS